jgi:AraC-like DNA-binding protein
MVFKRAEPANQLKSFVKEYWLVENDDTTPSKQKIIPDGFCEIIFHYGEPYRINLHGEWETQSNMLFAGQISNHFYLENTGSSGIIGIKLQPAAFYFLFGLEMPQFTNKVVELGSVLPGNFINAAVGLTDKKITPDQRIQTAESWLLAILQKQSIKNIFKVQQALDIIFEQNGMRDIETIAQKINYTRRHLEREFKKVVGLTPKLFSRIIRFNYIFQILKEGDASWISIALDSGHFDQAHFIKNFKEFTGEEPSQYGFDESNLANFFLKK